MKFDSWWETALKMPYEEISLKTGIDKNGKHYYANSHSTIKIVGTNFKKIIGEITQNSQ